MHSMGLVSTPPYPALPKASGVSYRQSVYKIKITYKHCYGVRLSSIDQCQNYQALFPTPTIAGLLRNVLKIPSTFLGKQLVILRVEIS